MAKSNRLMKFHRLMGTDEKRRQVSKIMMDGGMYKSITHGCKI